MKKDTLTRSDIEDYISNLNQQISMAQDLLQDQVMHKDHLEAEITGRAIKRLEIQIDIIKQMLLMLR